MAGEEYDKGQMLSKTCVACHGENGNSTVSLWPKLAGQNPNYLMGQMLAFKMRKRENAAMAPMVENLSASDMKALATYFSQQQTVIGFAKKATLEKGQRLYRSGDKEKGISACMACHGPSGLGNNQANFPRLSGQHADYTIQQLNNYRSGKRTTDLNQIMQEISQKMNDDDIQAVADYIEGLH